MTRKNSISGVKYSEEPAIFAWELMNEPRCESSSSAPILQVNIRTCTFSLPLPLYCSTDVGRKG